MFCSAETIGISLGTHQLNSLLRRGGFELRKWASNCSKLLGDIEADNHGLACQKILQIEQLKILGISWNPALDSFQFRVRLASPAPHTKRLILSTIVKLFDPLDWVTPVTIAAKVFMLSLWRLKIEWDDDTPQEYRVKWQVMHSKLAALNGLQIPRWTGQESETMRCELHGFADASNVAYAAVVYLRAVSRVDQPTITLLAGKSKVAPLKPMSIPRLELSAAVLLSRLIEFINQSFNLDAVNCHCWTDSTIVLHWVSQHPCKWKTFVANRVTEIQSRIPKVSWRHVSTDDNPAECASRGLLGDELVSHSLWWKGPSWLRLPEEEWPHSNPSVPPNASVEEKIVTVNLAHPFLQWDLAQRYSSWPTLIRVTAYVLRFVNRCRRRDKTGRLASPPGVALLADDWSKSRAFWLKTIQEELFFEEIHALKNQLTIPTKSPLISLNPFVDQAGLLRVGERLKNAQMPFQRKHPIILAAHPLVKLIVRQSHLRALHAEYS